MRNVRAAYMLQPLRERANSSTSRASRARLSALSMSVSVTSDGRSSSGSSATIPSSTSAYARGHAGRAGLDAGLLAERLRRPLDRPPADEWADGHDRSRRRAQRLPHSGQREDRPDRDHGVGRADDDRLGRGDRLEHRVGGRRPLQPAQLDALDRALAAFEDHELLERQLASARAHPGRHALVAHREHVRTHSHRLDDRPVCLGEAVSRAQQLGAHQAHREIAVTEAEPVRPPGAFESLHDLPGVVPETPAALVDLDPQASRSRGPGRGTRGRRRCPRRLRCSPPR